nr:sigma-70 family RNA polymerase sigma factor [uncultured Blautia sp.]
MAYNKAKAEYAWKKWKEKEESQLREAGVSEDMIKNLRKSDWEDFKAERRYFEHTAMLLGEADLPEREMAEPDIDDIGGLLNCVEDRRLLHTLLDADKSTLQIILFKMMGYQIKKIAEMTVTPEQTLYTRMNRLKKKIKKILEDE